VPASPRDWDASSYARVSEPIQALGRGLAERLELRGDETVLDAGCGSGTVALGLLERLPRGRVIAVDASPSMVERARAALPADRAEVLLGDLADLTLPEPVDVVFSSATFHWVSDHERLFARLFAALRPGGRLLAQCGGAGNIAEVRRALAAITAAEPFAAHLEGWAGPWNFATSDATAARLAGAGFTGAQAGLHTVEVVPRDPREYCATMILGAHLDRLPPSLREPFVEAVVDALGPGPALRDVRLTLSARRAA